MQIHRLTATFCKKVAKPGRYSDGLGLQLLVKPTGGKSWVQRIVIQGVRRDMGLGSFTLVTLAEARDLAYENARAARAGDDPRKGRDKAKMPTFAEAMDATMALRGAAWSDRYRGQWRRRMELHAIPKLGAMPVDAIQTEDVLRVLSPHWIEAPKVGRDLQHRIRAVLEWAVAQKLRSDNPAVSAVAALPKQRRKVRHHDALDYRKIPQAVRDMRAAEGTAEAARLALEFLVLTATRTSEVRCARWCEIDGDTWTIPAARMKAREEHLVPLSAEALIVLERARNLRGKGGLIFPAESGKAVSTASLPRLVERIGVRETVHGFRSSFRDWAGERTNTPREVAEICLAHAVGNQTERAYARSDLLAKRRTLMASWGAYCVARSGEVVQLTA